MKNTYSVVVPTYNEESTIQDCLESILEATDSPEAVEILVVDGESTDKTRQLVQEYESMDDSCVTLLTEYEGSTSAALNLGIRRSSNDIIVFVGGTVPSAQHSLPVLTRRSKKPMRMWLGAS